MPLPRPREGESKNNFISRFLSDSTVRSEFGDSKQRQAVAFSTWEEAKKDIHIGRDKEVTMVTKGLVPIHKVNEELGIVFGWASVAKDTSGRPVFDWQGDIFEPEVLEEAVYDYVLNFRDGGEMHKKRGVATLIESVIFTKEKMASMGIPEGIVPEGWWVGYKIHDPDVIAKVKSGFYKMFSIEGSGIRQPIGEVK